MITQNRIKTVLTLAVVATATLGLTAASAQATTITGTAGGNDSWNTAANWDAGVPSGAVDAVVSDGVLAQVDNAATPTYAGSLTLNANSTLAINNAGSDNALGSGVTMNAGSKITINGNFNPVFPPIALTGDASLETLWGGSDWQTTNFDGAITGTGTLTLSGFNGHNFRLKVPNSFSGGLIANAIDRWILTADAAGSLGTGDVTINPRTADARSAVLVINAVNAMADTATLTLNGQGWAGSNKGTYQGTYTRLDMKADDTIGGLIIDDVAQPFGDYTDASGDWISGTGTLTVKAADPTLPSVDAGVDMISWSGQAVTMDANVVNNDTTEPQGTLAYLWTAEPDGIGDPNLDVAITDADQEFASVTITKTAPTGDATVVTMTLAVTLEGKDPVTDTMTIDVYDDACLAAKAAGPVEIDPTDIDGNCITNFADFAVMATTWLDDYTLTGPVAK